MFMVMQEGFVKTLGTVAVVFLAAGLCQCARWTDINMWPNQHPNDISQRSTEQSLFAHLQIWLNHHGNIMKRSEEDVASLNLTANETLQVIDSSSTLEGTQILKIEEKFKGVPVYDAVVAVEVDRNDGSFTGQISGHILNDIGDDLNDVAPKTDEETIIQLMVDHYGVQNFSSLQVNLFIDKEAGEERARLVYRVSFFFLDSGIPSRPTCFIDANTGVMIRCYNSLERFKIKAIGGNEKTGKLLYGTDWPLLEVKKKNGRCRYKSDEVEVYDYKSQAKEDESQIVEFDCKEGVSDNVNGAFSPSTDAYYFGKMTVKMFKQWARVKVCPLPIILDVHYRDNRSAAFFDGFEFKFSDGDTHRSFPYVTVGVVAHEIAHCFTEHNAGLEYEGQSGAIDESFSDLAGEAVKYFIFGYNDWKTGKDVLKEGDYVRYMCDQSVDGYSITHFSQYTDETDVHFLSGLFNKVSCELANRSGWTVKYVFLVFAHANRFYWHPTSGFADAACGVIKAAYDLGHNVSDVVAVFSNVGVDTCNIDGYIRQVVSGTVVTDLTAGLGENILFKLKLTSNTLSEKVTIKIKTSRGTGDVDLYLGSEPTFKPSSVISSSTHRGNYELIFKKRTIRETELYVLLKPRLFSFSGVKLSVKVY